MDPLVKKIDIVLGKKTSRNIEMDHPVSWDDI